MAVNTGVVVGTVGIVAIGVVKALLQKQPITKIIIGGYLVGLTASLIDLVPGAGLIAGGIVMAAFLGVLLDSSGVITAIFGATGPQVTPQGDSAANVNKPIK